MDKIYKKKACSCVFKIVQTNSEGVFYEFITRCGEGKEDDKLAEKMNVRTMPGNFMKWEEFNEVQKSGDVKVDTIESLKTLEENNELG